MAKEVLEIEVKSDLGNVAKDLKDVSKGAKEAKKGVAGVGISLKSIAKASGIIFLLEKAFMLLKETLGKNQAVIDVFSTATTSLTIAFNDLFNYLGESVGTITGYFTKLFDDPVQSMKDFGNAIVENIIERFKSAIESIGFLVSAVVKVFSGDFKGAMEDAKEAGKEFVDTLTGVDDTFDKVAKTITEGTEAIKKYTTATWKQAEAITETANAAERSVVIQAKMNKEFAAAALVKQQIIDNELLSFNERQKALAELTRLTEENNEANIRAGEIRVKAAEDSYNLNNSEENWIALQSEKNSLMDVTAANLAAENTLFDNKILLNDQWNAVILSDAKREIALTKFVEESKMNTIAMGFQVASSLAKEGSAAAKGIAIAGTIFNTQQSIMKAMADVPYPYNIVQSALNGIMGASAIAKIMSTDPSGGGAGAGGGAVASAAPAPQMMSGAFDISGGVEPEAFKAYVVTDEMSNSQNQLSNIRRRATI